MDKLRRVIPGNRRIFIRNFMCVLLFSCVVIAVYQHQIHQMILSDVGVLNLSTLEKNIQTIDGVMLSLRELAYTVSSEESMMAFWRVRRRWTPCAVSLRKMSIRRSGCWLTIACQAPMWRTFMSICRAWGG